MSYNSLEEIVRECQEKDLPFDEVILLDDMNERNVSREESIETMRGMWEAMKGAERNYDGSLQSRSGLVGGAGKTMRAYVESGNTLCGPFVGKVMASALAMGESMLHEADRCSTDRRSVRCASGCARELPEREGDSG